MVDQLPQDLTFLFQGDSITDGGRGRTPDPNHILGHGYVYLVSARLAADFADQRPVFHNRGISGNRVTDLYGRWQEDALAFAPDVLSILVGINDADVPSRGDRAIRLPKYEKIYRLMLDESFEASPDLKLVLCEPFVMCVGPRESEWEALDRDVRARRDVVARLADEYQAAFVPCQTVLDAALAHAPADYWLWDGVHPTWAGHQLIADAWLDAFANRFAEELEEA